MRIVDEIDVRASPERVFSIAAQVERWPEILPHYRRVRLRERTPERSVVEMAAWRPFPGFSWPTWWVSEMWIDAARRQVRYRHLLGVTRGMKVVWRVEPRPGGAHITLIHDWDGPAWPLIGRPAARWIILPVFVHGIASRTLAGVKRRAESTHA
ncbi:MAG TPA: SRPBCC family protein [Gemmatimonadales bacterium]|jgi:ribosome-associated toxin RatA of RatAB toxin-antitoxin module